MSKHEQSFDREVITPKDDLSVTEIAGFLKMAASVRCGKASGVVLISKFNDDTAAGVQRSEGVVRINNMPASRLRQVLASAFGRDFDIKAAPGLVRSHAERIPRPAQLIENRP